MMKNFRWYIAGLLCLATIINYVDRQAWSITTPIISNVIKLSFSKSDLDKAKSDAIELIYSSDDFKNLDEAKVKEIVDSEFEKQLNQLKEHKIPKDEDLKKLSAAEKTCYDLVKKAMDGRVKALIMIVMIAFEIGYILGPTPLGWFLDRIGTRKGYPFTMAFWSLAGIITVWALQIGNIIDRFFHLTTIPIIAGFALCRFILGLGESGNWPAAIKTIGEWFPTKERAFAIGIFNSGSSVGAFIAPFVIKALIDADKNIWQPPFIVAGLFGFVWILAWLYLYYAPEKHPKLTKEEYEYIVSDRPKVFPENEMKPLPWYEGLKYRQVRGVLLSRFCAENLWKFSMYWLPLYLTQSRGVDINKMFFFVAAAAISSEFGNLVGGWMSSYFIKIGWSINKSRKSVMIPCGIIMIFALLVPYVSLALAILIMCLVTFCYQAWSVNMQTIPADVVPHRALGATAGLAHITAGLAGLLTNTVSGLLDFSAAFIFLGIAAALALFFLIFAVGKIDPEEKVEG